MSDRLATDRVVLKIDGGRFGTFTDLEITRDMAELCGSFSLRCLEPKRVRDFLGGSPLSMAATGVAPGHAASLAIDGEEVLAGWIDRVQLSTNGEDLACTIQGRDKACDLVDCAALPDGPAELLGLTLTEIVARIGQPFGLKVRAEVDVGARFPRFGIDPGETAAEAIRKACAQRAVLCVSDGIGGLVLTRGGRQRGPAPIRLGESVVESDVTLDWEQRFGEVIVRGQTEKAAGNRRQAAALDASAAPLSGSPPAPLPAPAGERAGVLMTGRARDQAITRFRPRVVLAQTQSGGASVQQQAEWAVRVQRGRATVLEYTVTDWRAGEGRALWRPNELVLVDDRLADVLEDMLVVGVTYLFGDQGSRTRLRLAGRSAFDLVEEGSDRQSTRARGPGRALDGSAGRLTAEPPPPIRRPAG